MRKSVWNLFVFSFWSFFRIFFWSCFLAQTVLAASQSDSIPSWASQFEIDRIEIKGVTVFQTAVVEKQIEINPGDRFERGKVLKSEENLSLLYHLHGYPDVNFQIRLIRKTKADQSFVLEINVNEGAPVRVQSVTYDFNNRADQSSEELTQKWGKKVKKVLAFKPQDIFDQEKIVDSKRAVLELFASQEFIGSSIEHQFVSNIQPATARASSWVDLQFKIDLGERVTFGFRNNVFFTRGYLDTIIEEMRTVGLGKDYLTAIKTRLEDEYRNFGFAGVEITPYTIESPSTSEKKVTYVIKEGSRVKIGSVEFDGNTKFTSAELQKPFFEKGSTLLQNQFYVEKDVQRAADLLIEWYKERGYLSAKLITINTINLPRSKVRSKEVAVKIMVYLYEGYQTIVQSLTLNGCTEFSHEQLADLLHQKEDLPLNLFTFEEGLENLKKVYRDRGYLDFSIKNEVPGGMIRYSQDNRVAEITLELEEGMIFRVGRIEVEGLDQTHPPIVLRELRFREGEILRESDILESERRLRKLGIFSQVGIRTLDDPSQPGTKIVRVVTHEADRGILTYGPGIRNDLGFRAFGQLAYTNIWGLNHTAAINLSANRRFDNYNFGEGQAQLSYAWPWFAGVPELTFRPSFFIGQTQYINFAAFSLNSGALWEKPFYTLPGMTHPLVFGSFAYILEKINQFNAVAAVDNNQFRIGTLTPRLSLDLRDNPLAPHTGLYLTSWVDVAFPELGTQDLLGYYRTQFRADYYLPLGHSVVWYYSFRTGFEQSVLSDPTSGADSIPFIKQFALGGINSIRGYNEQEINVQGSFFGKTLAYVNYRTQVDFPFAGALKLGVFVDAANLLIDGFSLGMLLCSTGFGFHYQTPVGPVSLDFGFKLNQSPLPSVMSGPYVIHFSVGVI